MSSIGEDSNQLLELSDLPDEILIRILSLLPTKNVVRTCLLLFRRSGKQDLWKYLTSLQFHSFNQSSDYFVERVMDLRDHSVPLLSFSLDCLMTNFNVNRVTKWITDAVQCNVQHLTLSIINPFISYKVKCLPSCMFECQSLVKLDLEYITFDVPSSSVVCLPLLKYLRLFQVIIVGDESTEELLSSPLLEELIIDQCSLSGIDIGVCSPKLQVLKIWDCDLYDSYDCGTICIIGDNLKYFSYTGKLRNEFWICASSSTQLTKVEIYVEEKFSDFGQINSYHILKGFYGTPNLALSDYFLEGLQKKTEHLNAIPMFECLTRLDIKVYKEEISVDSLALMKLYERCPHLEYLNIGKLSNTKVNLQLSPIPLCFQTSLKKILIHYYVPGDNKADAAIDLLLNTAFILEELVIFCERDDANGLHEGGRKIQELQNRLNRRPRVSKDCIISVIVTHCTETSLQGSRCFYDECYVKSMSEC